jgi:hypothetical protein
MHDTWHVGGRTEARGVPASTVEPGYFAPMRVDEFGVRFLWSEYQAAAWSLVG